MAKICEKVEGCEDHSRGKGLCEKHMDPDADRWIWRWENEDVLSLLPFHNAIRSKVISQE